jgi:hypothetical protein
MLSRHEITGTVFNLRALILIECIVVHHFKTLFFVIYFLTEIANLYVSLFKMQDMVWPSVVFHLSYISGVYFFSSTNMNFLPLFHFIKKIWIISYEVPF